jgi:hypothetical protein
VGPADRQEVSVIDFGIPRAAFYRSPLGIVEAGRGNRGGSDQMVWTEVVEHSIAVIEEARFLSEEPTRTGFECSGCGAPRLRDAS